MASLSHVWCEAMCNAADAHYASVSPLTHPDDVDSFKADEAFELHVAHTANDCLQFINEAFGNPSTRVSQ